MAQDEGSDERAAERGAPMDNEALALAGGDLPYLGDPEVAAGVIRDMLSTAFDAYRNGDADAAFAAAEKAAGAFLGADAGFAANAWFSPSGVGDLLARSLGTGASAEEATNGFMLGLISRLLDAAQQWEADGLTEEETQFQIDALVDDAVSTLLGISVDAS